MPVGIAYIIIKEGIESTMQVLAISFLIICLYIIANSIVRRLAAVSIDDSNIYVKNHKINIEIGYERIITVRYFFPHFRKPSEGMIVIRYLNEENKVSRIYFIPTLLDENDKASFDILSLSFSRNIRDLLREKVKENSNRA